MSNSLRQSAGKTLSLAAPYDRSSGQGALIGSIFGVAEYDVLSGAAGEFVTEGVHELAKTSAQAWTVGQPIAWDNTNKRLDSDLAVGPLVATAVEVAANPSSTGVVKLLGQSARRANVIDSEASVAPTSKLAAGAVAVSAAEALTGILVIDPGGASRVVTLPTAALLVAALPQAKVGDTVRLKIVNGADLAETLTIDAGTGGTYDANQTAASRVIAQNNSKEVMIRVTNVTAAAEAYVAYI